MRFDPTFVFPNQDDEMCLWTPESGKGYENLLFYQAVANPKGNRKCLMRAFRQMIEDDLKKEEVNPETYWSEEVCLEEYQANYDPLVFTAFPEEMKTEEVCRNAIGSTAGNIERSDLNMNEKGLELEDFPPQFRTIEFLMESEPEVYGGVYFMTQPMLLEYVKRKPENIGNIYDEIIEKYPELCYEAVKQFPEAIEYIPEEMKTEEFLEKLVTPTE